MVVVTADRAADPEAANTALGRLHHAHSCVEHFAIAKATEFGAYEQIPFVVFDVPAQIDFATVLASGRRCADVTVDHAAADAFIYYLREGLGVAAEQVDPRDGGPICLGAIGHSNLLFAPDGHYWLIGLGHNVAACDEHGRIGGRPVFATNEVRLGARPTPIADYIALIQFGRSVMELSTLAPLAVRVIKGAAAGEGLELLKHLLWLETKVLGAAVQDRPTVEECVEVAWRIRRILDREPDIEGFWAAVGDMLQRQGYRVDEGLRRLWHVSEDGAVLRSERKRIELRSRPQRRVLRALFDKHLSHPGARLSVEQLFAAGWPGERMQRRSSANRVYVAVNGLRKRGLGDDIESGDGGYRLCPATLWRSESPGSP